MEEEIRIEDLVETVKKRWKLIVIITLTFTLISAMVSFFLIEPKYEATTKLFIGKEEGIGENSYNSNDIQMYQKLMKTYSEMISSRDLINRALESSKIEMKQEDVLKNIIVSPISDTQILEIKFRSISKEEAKKIIEAVTDEFIIMSKELVPNSNIKIIETVQIPENPISPNKKINIVIAFILGLITSIGLVFLLEFLDNTFKTKNQLERQFKIPVLGVIPEVNDDREE